MQCLWLENQALSVREAPRPVPAADEALIRVRVAGLCRTDQELCRGYYPFTGIPGHEFVGEVVEAASDPGWVGKRVVGEINAACGQCAACRARRTSHCSRRTVLGIAGRPGVFAEYVCLPTRNLRALSPSLSDEAAVFTEPIAACCQILQQVPITCNARVLLVGAGKLGFLIAQVLSVTGCDLTVVARYPRQRELIERLGIRIVEEAGVLPAYADVAIEATGSPAGFAIARRALRPRGTLILKSTYQGRTELDLSALVVDEVTLVGSRCGPFDPALRLLEAGLVKPAPLVEGNYLLFQAVQAFEHAARPGAGKILLHPQQTEASQ